MARGIVLLVDGLRADVVTPALMPNLCALGRAYARAAHAVTVTPSVTVAALASFATGVSPATHGLVEPGLAFLSRLGTLRPIARELARHRVPSLVVAGALAARSRAVAWTLATCAGVTRLLRSSAGAAQIVHAAVPHLTRQRTGLGFVYVPDCDRAGHQYGWMSSEYLDAARGVDAAVALLTPLLDDSLLVVVSDHGGGGVIPTDHDAEHPINARIPLILAGERVRRLDIAGPVSLLDVPPTLLDWFGVPVPRGYEGRALREAFEPAMDAAVA